MLCASRLVVATEDLANTAGTALVGAEVPLLARKEMTSVLSARITSRMVGGAPVCDAVDRVWRSAVLVTLNPSFLMISVARASH